MPACAWAKGGPAGAAAPSLRPSGTVTFALPSHVLAAEEEEGLAGPAVASDS